MVSGQLEALAAETRRGIYLMLVERPRSVSELADELPVSRPAVSQHLKVLVEADLARVSVIGNRRLYSADPDGIALLRDWAARTWDQAMGHFADFARREEERKMADKIDPIVKRITVPGGSAEVFELFTTRLGEWWPLSSFSVAGDDAADARLEPVAGGRVYEVTASGEEHEWGVVVEWQGDRRIAFDWHPGSSISEATRVEISFLSMGGQTEVTLVHDGWESTGESAQERRDSYDDGWDAVLSRVPGATPAPVPASS